MGTEPTKSKALIACGDRDGCVLWYTGDHLKHEIKAVGTALEDLGLDDAPHGLSVWEGIYVWIGPTSFDDDSGYSKPVGEFRTLTDAEWDAVRENRNPFGTCEGDTCD